MQPPRQRLVLAPLPLVVDQQRESLQKAEFPGLGILLLRLQRVHHAARPGDVMSHTLRNALSMLLVGLAAGLAGAFALTRVLKSLLFQVSALDPVALGVACVLMTLIGILASLIPASRAAGVDPMTVLRDEG
jgi:hypothetical protein